MSSDQEYSLFTALYRTEDRLPLDARLDNIPAQAPVLKLKHDDMLDEVKNFLINALRTLLRQAMVNLTVFPSERRCLPQP